MMALAPVFSTPADLRCETGPLSAWYTAPPGAVVQLTEAAVLTKAMVEWIVGPGYDALMQRFPNGVGLRLLLDFRPMLSREPAARRVIMTAASKYLLKFAKVGVIPPSKPPPLYMTTLHGAVALVSAIGSDVRIYSSLEEAQAQLQLQPALG